MTGAAVVDMLDVALILFVRNPEAGKVKTRLAKTIGNDKALTVYKMLLKHTKQITEPLSCRKFVYYSDIIIEHDLWSHPGYTKRLQFGDDLGKRMSNAFKALFEQGFNKVLIIGSDCYQLQVENLKEAIGILDQHDAVIGPTVDGGYYLLGMTAYIPEVFLEKQWSTDNVCVKTVLDFKDMGLKFSVLDKLYDVDEAADLESNGIVI